MTHFPQVTWRNIQPDLNVVKIIEAAAEKMTHRYGDPTTFRVVISRSSNAHPDEPEMEFRLEMHLKGRDYLVTHDGQHQAHTGNNEAAIRHALDVLNQQVAHANEKKRRLQRQEDHR